MTVEQYAAARESVGDEIVRVGSMYWVVSKGLFYRPLLRHETYTLSDDDIPHVGLGGFQYCVPETHPSHSTMGLLVYDQVKSYSLETMGHFRRRVIKRAAKCFTIAPISDLDLLVERGHPVYLSFYKRTGYRYKSDRARRDEFGRWAKAVLGCPKVILLGGFGPSGLVAISVSYWVHRTLILSSFISETPALEKGVGELMTHTLREIASRAEGISEIFIRPFKGGVGMDNYYLIRGATLLRKPAHLYLHPATKWFLKIFSPGRNRDLSGDYGVDSPVHDRSPSCRPGQRGCANFTSKNKENN